MRVLISFYFAIFFCQTILCQTKAKITNVDFTIRDEKILVVYSITDPSPGEKFTIDLKFINDKNEIIIPKSVSGDVGEKIKAVPAGKVIIWDITKDQVEITGNLKAVVTIISSKSPKTRTPEPITHYHGPSNVILSMMFPGFGGYFVDKNKTRSVLTTISVIGLAAYGITQKLNANKYYSDYKASTNLTEIDNIYNKANSANHKYYITTRIGAAIWIADIIWVTFKGIYNKNKARNNPTALYDDGLKINYSNNGLQLGYVIRF